MTAILGSYKGMSLAVFMMGFFIGVIVAIGGCSLFLLSLIPAKEKYERRREKILTGQVRESKHNGRATLVQ